jgi:hypothetical protein
MVRKNHIYDGMVRYAKAYKAIVEHLHLGDFSELAEAFSEIKQLSNSELAGQVRHHIAYFERKYGEKKVFSGKTFQELVPVDDYIKSMNRKQMESVLVVEHIKGVLGREQSIDTVSLISDIASRKYSAIKEKKRFAKPHLMTQ